MNLPLHDSEFQVESAMEFDSPNDWAVTKLEVFAYGPRKLKPHHINVEFVRKHKDDKSDIIDAYFFPEDLERLGILFQYLGKTAREARDG